MDVREKNLLVASHIHPEQGLNPQPGYVEPGMKSWTFWLYVIMLQTSEQYMPRLAVHF